MSEAKKTHTCLECNRKFLNSGSLATHLNKFHHKYNPSNLDSHRHNAEFSQTIQNEIDSIKKSIEEMKKLTKSLPALYRDSIDAQDDIKVLQKTVRKIQGIL